MRHILLVVGELRGQRFVLGERSKESVEGVITVLGDANLEILLRCRWIGRVERHQEEAEVERNDS